MKIDSVGAVGGAVHLDHLGILSFFPSVFTRDFQIEFCIE